jgi:hypothetical protein
MKSSKLLSALGIGLSFATITFELFSLEIKPVYADHCGRFDPTCSHGGCNDLDPTCNRLPGVAEKIWGEAGASGYQAAARIMRERNGNGQSLDEIQKRFLRQRYGDLVDQVSIVYSSRMMSEWCALGECITLGGVDSAAQTYCDRIYVSDLYKPNDADQTVLLAHELKHSQQCREKGGEGKFGFHYFREYKKANQNYANNSVEGEAENAAKEFAKNVICNQVGCDQSTEYYGNYNKWGIDLPVSLMAASTSGFQRIVNKSSGRCLDLQEQNNHNGGYANVYDCVDHPNQTWKINDLGNGYVRIVNRASGRCLDLQEQNNHNGGYANVYDCVDHPNQTWMILDIK